MAVVDDQHLLARCRSGDLDAFNGLVEIHQDRVYNLCLRMMGSASRGGHTQEAFIVAFRRISTLRGDNSRSWLLRIVSNICVDQLRRRNRRPPLSLDPVSGSAANAEPPDSGEGPEEAVLRHELAGDIHQAPLMVPPDRRLAVLLCDVEGMAYEEIATVTQTSVGIVKSRINRGEQRSACFSPSGAGSNEREDGLIKMRFLQRHPYAQEDLSAYVDGALFDDRVEKLRAHLADCQLCRSDLEALQSMKAAVRGLSQIRSPRSFAIGAGEPRAQAWNRLFALPLAGSAALLLLVAVAGYDQAVPGDYGDSAETTSAGQQERSAASQPVSAGAPAEAKQPASESDSPAPDTVEHEQGVRRTVVRAAELGLGVLAAVCFLSFLVMRGRGRIRT